MVYCGCEQRSEDSPYTCLWVPCVKFRSSGFMASSFTHSAISMNHSPRLSNPSPLNADIHMYCIFGDIPLTLHQFGNPCSQLQCFPVRLLYMLRCTTPRAVWLVRVLSYALDPRGLAVHLCFCGSLLNCCFSALSVSRPLASAGAFLLGVRLQGWCDFLLEIVFIQA